MLKLVEVLLVYVTDESWYIQCKVIIIFPLNKSMRIDAYHYEKEMSRKLFFLRARIIYILEAGAAYF